MQFLPPESIFISGRVVLPAMKEVGLPMCKRLRQQGLAGEKRNIHGRKNREQPRFSLWPKSVWFFFRFLAQPEERKNVGRGTWVTDKGLGAGAGVGILPADVPQHHAALQYRPAP